MNEVEYYNKAKEYLLSFENVTDEILEKQLKEWEKQKPQSMNELFKAFLVNVKNRQGMPNSIGDIDKLSKLLFDFNHIEVLNKYPTWELLFDAIEQSEYTPPGRMRKLNNKNYWVIYCKSILSIASFLKPYKTVRDFQEFIDGFLTNEQSKLALPLLLAEEIFGFRFALACDFIKENISAEFIKPDVHINKLAQDLDITQSTNNFHIFKDVLAYCDRINKLPYEVDKIFWLVGSGNFYLSDVKIKSSKKGFLEMLTSSKEELEVAF